MAKSEMKPLDLASIRARLAETEGRSFWKSLEELAGSEEFKKFLYEEFPYFRELSQASLSRRDFMRLMGASLALAGLSACSRPPLEEILPYVRAPEGVVPGESLFFATAMVLDGFATGVLVESRMGRPIKVEGNPRHPASLGGTDIFGQASVLQLWDPDRAQAVRHQGERSTWEAFLAGIGEKLETFEHNQGKGLYLLTPTISSPTLISQLQALGMRFPHARWHHYQPVHRDNGYEGARLVFGEPLETHFHLDRAQVILSLDADFLGSLPGHLRHARDFAKRRRIDSGQATINRLYVAEGTPTITGAMADHRLSLRPSQVSILAWYVAQELGIAVPEIEAPLPVPEEWIRVLVGDLHRHGGASLVVAGERQPPFVHGLAHAMNHVLGNVGKTLTYTAPVVFNPLHQNKSLRHLRAKMAAGEVDTLIMLGGNPVFSAPADLAFSEQLSKVDLSVYLGLYEDETAAQSDWHIPEAHYLESWSDARAYEGTVSLLQPLIAPLYQGKSSHELIAVLLGEDGRSSYEILREYWQKQWSKSDFENAWSRALQAGVIEGTALLSKRVKLRSDFIDSLSKARPEVKNASGIEIIFMPDPTIWDGQFSNNGWLQELPKPITKLTWDNAALISPRTAERLGLANEEIVELRYQGRQVQAPIWIVPGHADEAVTVTLGYGREQAGQVGTGTGFNAYVLRTADAPWFGLGLEVVKTGKRHPLATTQHHHSMEGRDIVRIATLSEFQENPNFAHQELPSESLYPRFEYSGYAWGMAIDQNACIGCNACVVACQAENNIPVVGKEQVSLGREMHWLRIDRYYSGSLENPRTYFQPVPCMHCENAPCELVCPTAATVHDSEGLNLQVYNRCIGTRFCSNNCPYKVRRFNFLQYAKDTPGLAAQRNPEVTVRMRGVMEKCTYCVQRISRARAQAEIEGRRIQEGEVLTACQAACPTEAIQFGNLNDPESRVSQAKASPLHYALLGDLNTHPRTTYLAKLTNPNPDLKAE
ncbi:molybdopterin oxidoreductase, iron-sulfur binding subunit [Nitrosococcus halophilus Nc 4]|uniref:Molybdopterin oxidoreductase, iron-sulfur binding subunit n=1 Tax=Nitrosococcus halophilus (strain Nc4) TaxID=472759 RepID=D5BWM3_NITHN|nr:TAT-variant-translocated molybdopterin oxidoreductase [Nitrosococcus halophilus]ADE15680.1 molybdopterin oxidoreductase, iron-sulfur binding subunit [Nitrosococcus halophilus Nc 4]